jgi:hypothetical protein
MKKTLLFLAAALNFCMAANAQVALSENFDNCADGSVPTGWTTYGDGLTNHYTSPSTLNDSWSALQQAMVCITWTEESSAVDRWLVTPQVTVPTTNPMLVFDIAGVNFGPESPYAESLKVMVSTTDNQKASFSVLEDLGNLLEGNNTYGVNLSSYAGQSIYLAFACYTADGTYIFLDNVEVKTVAANCISAVSATAPAYSPQNGNCNVNLTVRNEGSSSLAAFDVTYSVNGGDEQTLNVTGVDVASFAYYTYTFPVQMLDLGVALINITVSNPNNDTDADESDNSTSCETNVYDPASVTDRNTVLEHFTTARCVNCPAAHERLETAVQGRENRVIWIAHHVGYYTDDMTINESNQMTNFYNDGGSTYAPAVMLDRDNGNATSEDPGPVFFPDNDVADHITNAIAAPAFVTVNITDVNYDAQSRQLSLTVSGNFVSGMTFDSPRLSVYIMQDDIWGSQTGATGKYQHNHVIRGCITDVWGDATAITNTTAGSTFSKTYTYTLPTKFNAKNCWVAAFVSNYSSDVNNCRIANGAKTGYILNGEDPTTGIGDVQANMKVVTYPNPTTEMAYVSTEGTIRSYEMVDAMGRKVMAQENVNADILELNVSNLSAGIYFITVTTDKGVATQRLNVTK